MVPVKCEEFSMISSRDRILTTHVGSLPRNEKLSDLLVVQEEGKPYDATAMNAEMDAAVRHVVKKQMDAGIDIGNDGEQRRIGFQTYVPQRMTGFAGVSKRRRGIEFEEFPELIAYLMRRFPNPPKSQQGAPEAQADIKYKDMKPITDETQGFRRIADELGAFSERFMTAPSPGIISTTMLNAYYKTHDDYLDAIAREMKNEYQAIHKAGFILQIDAPDLAMDRVMMYRDLDDAGFVKRVEKHVASINDGIVGIPRDRVRLHVCYGNWEGPHIHDVALEKILPGQSGGAVDRVLQSAARARIRSAQETSAAQGHAADSGRDRDHQQFRRASRGRRAAYRGSGAHGRGARAGHRLDRLRLRHLYQARMGDRAGGVAETRGAAQRRRHRIEPAVGAQERGIGSGLFPAGLAGL
jgi:methionine synthase II (cobalamin-independent)